DVVISPALQAGDDVLAPALGSQQNDIGRLGAGHAPYLAAQLQPVQARHHPVKDGQPRRILLLEELPGGQAVVGRQHLVAPLRQGGLEHAAVEVIVFGNQNFHGQASSRSELSTDWIVSICPTRAASAAPALSRRPSRPIASSRSAASAASAAAKNP